MADLFRLSASEAAARIRDGKLTAEALVRSCLERLDARDSQVKAWVHLDRDFALRPRRWSESDHAKFPQLRQSSPMEACFLVLEPHFCCQIGLCKLHQILATHTSHPPAQVYGAAL